MASRSNGTLKHMRAIAIPFVCLLLLTSAVSGQNQVIFQGGGAGTHVRSAPVNSSITFPQINNAGGPTGVTDQAAWLNGMLTCTSASPTTVRVYWGLTDEGANAGAWDDWTNLSERVEWVNLTTNPTLSSSTTYFYRFHATNTQGQVWAWPAKIFKTYGPPVVDNRVGANPKSSTYATLTGTLTDGGNSYVSIYSGQDTNNWAVTNDLGQIGQGSFSTEMTGLSKSTTYYYHCFASNAYGTSWSSVTNFTTGNDVTYVGGSGDGYDLSKMMALAREERRGTVFIIR